MSDEELIAETREKLRQFRAASSEERRQHLRRLERLISPPSAAEPRNERRRWDAKLAIISVGDRNRDGKIRFYRCLVPAFGLPGSATVVVSREHLIEDIRKGDRVITAVDRGDYWEEGQEVHLTEPGYLRTDPDGDLADNLDSLPIEQNLKPRYVW